MSALKIFDVAVRPETFIALPEKECKKRDRLMRALATSVSALTTAIRVLAASMTAVILGLGLAS